ncbi:MAG: LysM peptidoglycan-binding domain-containing protein, partial [Candidatus Amulumruptor sp.]|nr:LysM peptidoglycan-binding domain-containing protein [Candidatus Amulumruptor sp.]
TTAPAKKAAAKPAGPTKYKVRSGDKLSKLARRFGVTVKQIQDANGMGNSVALKAGQTITIPAPKAKSSKSRKR